MTTELLRKAIASHARRKLAIDGFSESAVLAALLLDGDEPLASARLVLTVRHAELRTHAGQISLPGGRREPTDRDLVETALREAREEIGLPTERVEVLGVLDDVPTPSKFVITPVVGIVHGPVTLQPQAAEVADVFEATLAELADPTIYREGGTRRWQDVEYVMHEYHVGTRRIWGATARMVHQLLELTFS